jgi:TetR/AcrR family transcriptional regulator, mexJK operon transcriptional repressor
VREQAVAAGSKVAARAERRGRPSVARLAEIGTAIRTAALEVFLEAGYEAASMDAIAARAKVSKATLYARFASKDELFEAVLEDEMQRWSRHAEPEADPAPTTLAGRLRRHARILTGLFAWPRYQQVNRLIASTVITFPHLERLWHEGGTRRYLAAIADDIATASDVAAVDPVVAETCAHLFLYGLSGWHYGRSLAGAVAEEDIAGFVDRVVGLFSAAQLDAPP